MSSLNVRPCTVIQNDYQPIVNSTIDTCQDTILLRIHFNIGGLRESGPWNKLLSNKQKANCMAANNTDEQGTRDILFNHIQKKNYRRFFDDY